MTGKQTAVLWIGLILVAANLVLRWADIRSVIFTGSGQSAQPGKSNAPGKPPSNPLGKIPIIGPIIPGAAPLP